MELYCDGDRVYMARNYRIEGFSKKDLLERAEAVVVWQSEKLSDTPKKLVNTRFYLVGAGGSKLFRIDRRNGSKVEIDAGAEIIDITSNLREVYFATPEGIYRVPAERCVEAEIKRLSISDLLDKPVKSLDLLGDHLFVIAGNFLYKLTKEGEMLYQKAFAEGIKVLSDYEGCVAVKRGEIVYFTEELEVLSNGAYEGEYVKVEHGAYNTFLLSDKSFSVFGKTGKRYAHVEDAHYESFTEGLNHIYFFDKEGKLSFSGKKDLLGDNFQEIDLTTLIAIIMASLMLLEEKGNRVALKEEKGFIDLHINHKPVDVEKVILTLSRYFPEVFYLYKNPGYYDQIDTFAERFDLFKVEGKELRLNTLLLERLIQMHSTFKVFSEDIVRGLVKLAEN